MAPKRKASVSKDSGKAPRQSNPEKTTSKKQKAPSTSKGCDKVWSEEILNDIHYRANQSASSQSLPEPNDIHYRVNESASSQSLPKPNDIHYRVDQSASSQSLPETSSQSSTASINITLKIAPVSSNKPSEKRDKSSHQNSNSTREVKLPPKLRVKSKKSFIFKSMNPAPTPNEKSDEPKKKDIKESLDSQRSMPDLTNSGETSKSMPDLNDSGETSKTPLYCFCHSLYDDSSEMIACDNRKCPIEWFHFKCVNIVVPPEGEWFCPGCAANQSKSA